MEDLWPVLLVAAVFVFVFYILAQHWHGILRQQSRTIRGLFQRVQSLEEMANPEFRRRLGEIAPVPLERVFTFSFRLGDRFWRNALQTTEEDRRFIRECGSFVGSVKLERWRSHTVATITEVLPDRKTDGWHTRSLDFYSDPAKTSDALTLWDLALSRPGLSSERPPSLELVLRRNSVELCGHLVHLGNGDSEMGRRTASGWDDVVFFRAPLDTAHLAEFRSHDPVDRGDKENGGSGANETAASAGSWQAFYSYRNEDLGIEWQLHLRDLTKQSEWERWGVLDSDATPLSAEEK